MGEDQVGLSLGGSFGGLGVFLLGVFFGNPKNFKHPCFCLFLVRGGVVVVVIERLIFFFLRCVVLLNMLNNMET